MKIYVDERRPTAGVIFLRIATRIPIEHRAQIVVNMLRKYKDKLEGTFTSITESAIDVRHPLL